MRFKFIVLAIGVMCFSGCVNKKELTKPELKLLEKLGINSELVTELKTITNNKIKQLPAIETETGDIINTETFAGIYSESSTKKGFEIVNELKPKFKKKGYLVFYIEGENGTQLICIIKGNDELDILRYRKTNGANYNLESKDVIQKITEWQSKYGVAIIGCSQDYVDITFDTLPQNMDEFTNEVYKFCPDSVEQGVGDVKSLKEYIISQKGIWLWWD
jgi:Domain of unknown function (DUF4253)